MNRLKRARDESKGEGQHPRSLCLQRNNIFDLRSDVRKCAAWWIRWQVVKGIERIGTRGRHADPVGFMMTIVSSVLQDANHRRSTRCHIQCTNRQMKGLYEQPTVQTTRPLRRFVPATDKNERSTLHTAMYLDNSRPDAVSCP
jgi:hypothetical protein